jgi:DNA-binding response OmpR family regulator
MLPLDGIRILVLERSVRRGRSARALLERSGARVALAGTASAACSAALALHPELILSGAGFASAEWHPVIRLLGESPPAILEWKGTASPEAVTDLALRLYTGSRR